ncbi:unnamed protein product, partial [Laminaria digitata]
MTRPSPPPSSRRGRWMLAGVGPKRLGLSPPPGRTPDRIGTPPTPRSSTRSYRDVIAPPPSSYVGRPVDSVFLNVHLDDFSNHVQHGFPTKVRTHVHRTAKSLLDTFEPYPGATLRQVFRHIATAPASSELTAAAHALVVVLRQAHADAKPGEAEWPNRSTLSGGAASSS